MRYLLLLALIGSIIIIGLFIGQSSAIDNGLGLTPPMGWRSWNQYGININQQLFLTMIDKIAERKRLVDGVPTSLCDIGYCDIGVDMGWEQCGNYGPDHYTQHTEAGYPTISQKLFPDLKQLTDYAHSKGLTAGWYFNGCLCYDPCGNGNDYYDPNTKCYQGDIGALFEFGFDNVKLDGCGKQRSIDNFARFINETGKAMIIENCHWGQTLPNATWCPFNYYRTSNDIQSNYGAIISNLQTTIPLAEKGLSYPGCWAYPDMLEVGIVDGVHGPQGDSGLNDEETRSHFGAWCIVSSPLILSIDLTNNTVVDKVWNIITNKEAIAINRAYAGHSGSPFVAGGGKIIKKWYNPNNNNNDKYQSITIDKYQYFYKPLSTDNTYYAILLMNHDTQSADLFFQFNTVPRLACSTVTVRDIWQNVDIGNYANSYTTKGVKSHDSVFLTIKCSSNNNNEEVAADN